MDQWEELIEDLKKNYTVEDIRRILLFYDLMLNTDKALKKQFGE